MTSEVSSSRFSADVSSGPSMTSLAASATLANTGALAPACSSGGSSFLSRKSPLATTLPATASRRASSYTWVRTAMLMDEPLSD